jgi:hypothetical protein
MAAKMNGLSSFGWFIVLAGAALSLYMMFNYVGPFEWLAELELRWFGAYDEKITFLVTFLVLTGTVALVALPMKKLLPRMTSEQNTRAPQAIVFQLIGIGFVVAGAIDCHRAGRSGALIHIAVADLESGKAPGSDWVEATGYALNDSAAVFDSGYAKEEFVPITSYPDGPNGPGVRLFVKAKDGTIIGGSGNSEGKYDGMLAKSDLPGPVRVIFQKAGYISGDYYVLDLGATPASQMSAGKFKIYAGSVLAALGVVVGLASKLRKKPQNVVAQ